MRAKTLANQGGSIVSFILVGTLLLVGLGGSIYYLSHRDNGDVQQVVQGDVDQDVALAPDDEEAVTGDDDESLIVLDDEDAGSDNQPAGTPAEDQPATAPEEDSSEEEAAPTVIATTGGPGSSAAIGQELPQTGPADMLISIVVLVAVTLVVAAFRRSRQVLGQELSN